MREPLFFIFVSYLIMFEGRGIFRYCVCLGPKVATTTNYSFWSWDWGATSQSYFRKWSMGGAVWLSLRVVKYCQYECIKGATCDDVLWRRDSCCSWTRYTMNFLRYSHWHVIHLYWPITFFFFILCEMILAYYLFIPSNLLYRFSSSHFKISHLKYCSMFLSWILACKRIF